MFPHQQQLADQFQQQYGCPPVAIARAPGRVNLIGEHIDYMGYGVMPLAITQSCHAAIAWEPRRAGVQTAIGADSTHCQHTQQQQVMRIANVQQPLYPSGQLELHPSSQLAPDSPGWFRYILAAYKGCCEFAAAQQQPIPSSSNILLLVQGDVPPGGGLSSSSALVVAAALALLALWGVPASPAQVAELTCSCERYVGTQGGGMDQAVSLMAQPGVAMHVEFNPVHASPVRLPKGAAFVVANCLAASHKAETAASRFNLRVLECRLAAMLLAKLLSAHSTATSGSSGHASYTLQQVAELLGCCSNELLALLPPPLQAAAACGPPLRLQQRALHVFSESQRVLQFAQVCADASLSDAAKLSQLGSLMDASHASCAGLYECSCAELDALVGAARAAGALGARLTGAGWGGCVVALLPAAGAPAFMQQVAQQFYEPAVAAGKLAREQLQACLFMTVPARGAEVALL
ncbi:hypothetical protein OEZ86_011590 [Tetradesmus obliquus]|nr:hypothetical protein OEZ86_011590 [Tetradesmus obliquus]